MKTQWMLIVSLLLAIVVAIFSIVNIRPVIVNFVFTTAEMPLVLVILASVLIGAFISGSFALFRRMQYRQEVKRLQAVIEEKEELLRQEQLRIVPQQDVVVRDITNEANEIAVIDEQ